MDTRARARDPAPMAMQDLRSGDHDFAAALRQWRRARGLSQLDLALSIDISARHLSFLETGRARPSRDMVHLLSEALLLPRAARNGLLSKAGFAPVYPASPLAADNLKPFRAMLQEMMARHAPNPAMICDRHWTILDANDTARALLSPLHGEEREMNIVRMLAQSPLAPEFIVNYSEVLEEMTGRIRLEALEAGPDPVLTALLRLLEQASAQFPPPRGASPRSPIVPIIVRAPAGELRFLSAIAHFGTSEDVTVRDLRLELLFPADDVTAEAMRAL
ncbi:MAG: helix-turn-helix domain-containing protein [Alphaproteobacteria bacterium]|nr:helix-turn-helix domain-containing protein [Alphaproteobacteria bacterium]